LQTIVTQKCVGAQTFTVARFDPGKSSAHVIERYNPLLPVATSRRR
jgi:hypothetical protein